MIHSCIGSVELGAVHYVTLRLRLRITHGTTGGQIQGTATRVYPLRDKSEGMCALN